MLCVVCGRTDSDVISRIKTPRNEVVDLLKKWASKGEFVDASVRSVKDQEWSWHKQCLQRISDSNYRRRYGSEDALDQEDCDLPTTPPPSSSSSVSTLQVPSSTPTLRVPRPSCSKAPKKTCFFCGEGDKTKDSLRRVSTLKAVNNLKQAVHSGTNSLWKIQLPLDLDVLAADVFYHLGCWTVYVVNQPRSTTKGEEKEETIQVIEFVDEIMEKLQSGAILSMLDIGVIQEEYGIDSPRWRIKELLSSLIEKIEFTKPKNPREAELVHLPEARQTAIMNERNLEDMELSILLKAAKIIRQEVNKGQDWKFDGDMDTFTLPKLVQTFATWLVGGTGENSNSRVKKGASVVGQVLVANILSQKQVSNTTIVQPRQKRETPLQIATALAIHQETRSKSIVGTLNRAGISITYTSLLRHEASLARAVLNSGTRDGTFIPRRLEKNVLVHFGIDNIDFQEDTIDGKGTFHGTITVAFQPGQSPPSKLPSITFNSEASESLPSTIYDVRRCIMDRATKPKVHQLPIEQTQHLEHETWNNKDVLMLLAFGLAAFRNIPRDMPNWSAFNSRITERPETCPTTICTLPVLDAPAPEYSSLFTMMLEMENIQSVLNGNGAPVLVAADMALFSKLLQLKLTLKKDHWIVRLGDLHVVIAMLRCIGSYIEGSGLDEILFESGVYGISTAKQILAGNHINRGVDAHINLVSSLLALKFSANIITPAEDFAIQDLLQRAGEDSFNKALQVFLPHLEKLRSEETTDGPLSRFVAAYMKMVLLLLNYIRAVRTGDLLLHLKTLEDFGPFFFAMNRSSYARFVPVYVAMMKDIHEKNPRVWNYLREHWVVRKSVIPFTAIGCDHALEQVNRTLKVCGGLIGITRNPSARNKFFLIQDELQEIKINSFGAVTSPTKHHRDSPAHTKKNNEMIKRMVDLLQQHDPFTRETDHLTTVLSRKVVPEDVAAAISNMEKNGKTLFNNIK